MLKCLRRVLRRPRCVQTVLGLVLWYCLGSHPLAQRLNRFLRAEGDLARRWLGFRSPLLWTGR